MTSVARVKKSPDLTEGIFALVAAGESLRSVCRRKDMPAVSTVMKWLDEDEKLAEQYARAMYCRADIKFDELDDVSEDAASAETAVQIAGLRLKSDNIKWQLARMSPRKYGDRVTTELTGANGAPIEFSEVRRTVIDPKGAA